MAIHSVGNLQQFLKTHNTNDWVKESRLEKSSNDFLEGTEVDFGEAQETKSFGEFLSNSVEKVNNLQLEANKAIEELASGKTKNVAETLLTVERAEIAFKTMNQVRHKVIDAYREIMKMQV
jgi:flagellar hook-basal body complex protein FliE